jgi:hypothetical protein
MCKCRSLTACVRRNAQLLGFLRTKGESQAGWESLLEDLYRRGLKDNKLLLIVTDGCLGLAAAIQNKMRNISISYASATALPSRPTPRLSISPMDTDILLTPPTNKSLHTRLANRQELRP